jgi:hypothetical protein
MRVFIANEMCEMYVITQELIEMAAYNLEPRMQERICILISKDYVERTKALKENENVIRRVHRTKSERHTAPSPLTPSCVLRASRRQSPACKIYAPRLRVHTLCNADIILQMTCTISTRRDARSATKSFFSNKKGH